MASQWIRWNNATHIFEYSTDNGTSFAPLPLNASILTEGSIPDNRLSANIVIENGPNVFTDLLPISIENISPQIQFKETDAAVDSRFWRQTINGGTLAIQALTDALIPTSLLTLSRAGQLVVPGISDHVIGSTGSGSNTVRSRNLTAGAANLAEFSLDSDVTTRIGRFTTFSSSFATSGIYAAGVVVLESTGAAGLNISASNAGGSIQFFAGGNSSPFLRIPTAGGAVVFKTSDAATLTLTKSALATAGVAEGGLLITGFGFAHFGIGFIPNTGGGSKAFMGFGSSNAIEAFTKNIQIYHTPTIANNAVFQTTGSFTGGMIIITNATTNRAAIFSCSANGSFSVEVSDPTNTFSGVINTAGMINVYYIGGGTWGIQNLSGVSAVIALNMIGYAT